MDDNSKRINPSDSDKLKESDRADDSNLMNPGLKHDHVNSKEDQHPLEEKRAVEETSEDRLSEAE